MQTLLKNIIENHRQDCQKGIVASYIPELSKQDPALLGIALCDTSGSVTAYGDVHHLFTLQSIAKVSIFLCALEDNPLSEISKKINVSPTVDGFNSIVNLETKNDQRPLNPMINSGAIAAISLVKGDTLEAKFERIFSLIKAMCENEHLTVNEAVYQSEKETGDRNRALAYFMKSTRILEGDVDAILDVYFRLCSIDVSTIDIAYFGATLAKDGLSVKNNHVLFRLTSARITKAVMMTCGMYDASGDFAVDVGMPGKSGVGGGIVVVSPKKYGIGVFSPALDKRGNSLAGWQVLKELAEKLDLNMF